MTADFTEGSSKELVIAGTPKLAKQLGNTSARLN